MPPVDPEADRLIAEQFNRYPEARYRLTQLAFIQEHALAEAQNRIQRLEWEVQQARQAAQQAQQAQQQPAGWIERRLLQRAVRRRLRVRRHPRNRVEPGPAWNQGQGPAPNYQQGAPPPPQYAPGYQQGMFQRQGSGFLGSALTTAAGVAGGLVAGNALMGLFSGSHGMGGGFGGGFAGGAPGASPWGSAPAAPDQGYVDQGTWSDGSGGTGTTDPGYVDNGTWDTSGGSDQSSWTDNSGGSDSGWDTGGGSGGGSDDDSLI